MINKLINKIQKTKAPIVVGLDPMLSYVPEHIQKKAFAEYGETLEGAAEAIWQFNKEIVDKTYDLIPAVKPQIAMYEQYSRPEVWRGKAVPPILMSGHHANVEKWRREQSLLRTRQRRPDLLEDANLSKTDLKFLRMLEEHDKFQ